MGHASLECLTPSPDKCTVEAYHHQTALGWEAFHRGRISTKWQEAFSGHNLTNRQSLKWAGRAIELLLHYSHQLWLFRCGAVHGYNKEETRQKQRVTLLPQVQAAYEQYRKDPFHIPSHWRSLFTRPINSFLTSDSDTLTCWLKSYSEAVQQQNLADLKQQKSSQSFFSKSLKKALTKTTVRLEEIASDEDSLCSEEEKELLTYVPFDPGPRNCQIS